MNEITAEASVDINAPRSEVWKSLTDPARIKEYYLGAEVQTDWQVGSPITFKGEWDGKSFEDKGEGREDRRHGVLPRTRSAAGRVDRRRTFVTPDVRVSSTLTTRFRARQ
jgi:hypothetical protein